MLSMKKKKFQFEVQFTLQELSSVPFVTGVVYAKVRLIDGGQFTQHSTRVEISNHRVCWNCPFNFSCKLSASASSGILETSLCRVSVRKEQDGGRSCTKLGYVDINLAEFAGAGAMCRRYLLHSYNEKKRKPDNSILKVNINMKLTSGDVLFKAATPVSRSVEDLSPSASDDKQQQQSSDPPPKQYMYTSQSYHSVQRLPGANRLRRGSVDSGSVDQRSNSSNSSSHGNVSPNEDTKTSFFDNMTLSDLIDVPHTSPDQVISSNGEDDIGEDDVVDLGGQPEIPSRTRSDSQSVVTTVTAKVSTTEGELRRKGHGRASSMGASPLWTQKGHKRITSQVIAHDPQSIPTISVKSYEHDDESLASNKTWLSAVTMASTTSRVERTRGERAEDVIATLVQRHDLSQPEGEHSENLQLYVDCKGEAVLTGHDVDEKHTHMHRVDIS